MSGPVISAVIPVWGREHNLLSLLPALREALNELGEPYEIVVSGGTDVEPEVRGFNVTFAPTPGSGYGDILRAGVEAARGDYVVTLDSDFSHRPRFVRTMWAYRHEGELLLASRYVKGSYREMPFIRRILSRTLNLGYRKALALPYTDLSSGFRMYRRAVIEDIWPPRAHGLDILPELLVAAVCQGWKVAEVPFWYRGAQPFTRARMLRLGAGYARTIGRIIALRNSVRAADYDDRAFDSWIPLQRYWQRRRFQIIHEFLPDTGLVLDIGCGSSRIVQTMTRAVGMDLALRKLRWLRAPGRLLLQGDMNFLPFGDETFDAVVCSEVIEHIPRAEVRLTELVRVLRPQGVLILGTPDYARRRWRFLEWVYGKLFPGGYVKEHINPYTYAGLRADLESLGLDLLACRYVGGSEMIFKARKPELGPPRRAGLTAGYASSSQGS
jgi:SAM-dependent methyltransferase